VKLKKKDLIFIILLFSLFLVFFSPLVFTDATFFHRDIIKYYYPTKFFASESIQKGELPFWDPYLFCGNPFLAILQQGLFYPLSLLSYLLPFHLGFKYFFLVHLFLGGLFFYLLMRDLGTDGVSSFVTAGIYMFSSYMISMINLLTTLCAVIWGPLVFLLFTRAVRDKNYFFSILCGLILSFQFFAGQPEIVYMTILIMGMWCLFDIFFQGRKFLATPELNKPVLIFISMLAVFLVLSFIQILPFMELVKYSSRRAGVFFEQASFWSFHPLELVTLVIPSFSWNFMDIDGWFRQYWLRSSFIGIWPMIFVFFALCWRREREKSLFFFLLGLVSLIFSLGRYTPVYYFLFKYIPGFNFIRYPVKFMYIFNFTLVVLAGIGIQSLADRLQDKKDTIKLIRIAGVITIFFLGIILFFYLWPAQSADLLRRYIFPPMLSTEFINLQSMYIPVIMKECLILTLSLVAGIVLICFAYKNKLKTISLVMLLGLLIFFNLAQVNYNVEPIIKMQFYQDKAHIVDYLKGEGRIMLTPRTFAEITQTDPKAKDWKFDSNIYLYSKSMLLCNIGWVYHIFDAGGYASIKLDRYDSFVSLLHTQPTPSASPALNLLGVKYLISLWELNDPALRLYTIVNFVKIYENKNTLPRVSIIPRAIFIDDEKKIAAIMKYSSFNPTGEIIIETAKAGLKNPSPPVMTAEGKGVASITRYDSNRVDIEAHMSKPGWLLLTDTNYPGWKVYVDEREDMIYQADYLFRGVYLGSGEHKIRFVFEPTLFRLAMSVTVAGLVFLGVIGSVSLTRMINEIK
jgi:hypothetical protein